MGVLESIQQSWASHTLETYNHTNVYPHDGSSNANSGGTPITGGERGGGSTTSTTSSSQTSTTNSGQTLTSSGSLSTGAKIGIGVGLPLSVIALTLIILVFTSQQKGGDEPSEQVLESQVYEAGDQE
jgi:hypothetical protein